MSRRIKIVLCCVLLMLVSWGCGSKDTTAVFEQNSESGMRRTTLYFATEDGFIVPVMKSIPWEEGIGKAALSYLVSGEDNDKSASAMGLCTVIPTGTEFTLRIGDDKQATLDLKNYAGHSTAEEEQAMVTAIVNTLSEFDSIETVKITLEGKEKKAMPNGTDISKPMEKIALNVEEGEMPVSGTVNKLTLYFPNISASLNIPVTRYIDRVPSFSAAIQEMVSGPKDAKLLDCFPEGTELMGAYIDGGIAKVEFNKAFEDMQYTEGKLEAARNAIQLCANEFEEVYGVDVYVDGREYSMHTEAVSGPVYVNEFR